MQRDGERQTCVNLPVGVEKSTESRQLPFIFILFYFLLISVLVAEEAELLELSSLFLKKLALCVSS